MLLESMVQLAGFVFVLGLLVGLTWYIITS